MKAVIHAGADPGFFLGGGALVSCSTSTPINHIVFSFGRIPVVLENRRSCQGGAHPLHPPPRSAPDMVQHLLLNKCCVQMNGIKLFYSPTTTFDQHSTLHDTLFYTC